jgi:DNA-binding XRE family transcriptional regulator
MKKHPTKKQEHEILKIHHNGEFYAIPHAVAKQYRVEKPTDSISPEDVFARLNEHYTQAGALLKGLRHRENMTQTTFAEKINITQADLSKMENGRRPVGKRIAKRLAALFEVNYKLFLE